MKVPFLNLSAQYFTIQREINEAIQQVLDHTAFAGGSFVSAFERDFAEFCGCRYCVGVGTGTEAIWLALLALGVGPGDEVITVPNSFIATAEAVSFCGATPVFVDVDEYTYTMDPQKLYDYLKIRNQNGATRKKIKGIIPVHLFGQTADMDPILEIARDQELFLVEDACQAHGALYKGQPAGSLGDIGCFSFYPGKNLGAYGEAGAITTNDKAAMEKISMLRDHGQSQKYHHSMVGWNARMDGFQGAVLGVKLRYLRRWNQARRRNANLYRIFLRDTDNILLPYEADYAKHVYHIYAIRAENRNELIRSLAEKNIHCGIHYPIPIHLTAAYRFLGYRLNSFPVAEEQAQQFISLPLYPEMNGTHIEYVAGELKTLLESNKLIRATV